MNKTLRRGYIQKIWEGHPEDGKEVVDEMCGCGHPRSEHSDTLALGHGPCEHLECGCRQFTWVGLVTAK